MKISQVISVLQEIQKMFDDLEVRLPQVMGDDDNPKCWNAHITEIQVRVNTTDGNIVVIF